MLLRFEGEHGPVWIRAETIQVVEVHNEGNNKNYALVKTEHFDGDVSYPFSKKTMEALGI